MGNKYLKTLVTSRGAAGLATKDKRAHIGEFG